MKGGHNILGQVRERRYRFVRDIGKLIEEDTKRLERGGKLPKHEVEPISDVSSIDDYLVIPGIECVGADGAVFERYDRIYVAKDVERNGKRHISFTPYKAILHFEKKNMFLPSFALSCNVLACLFANKDNEDCNKALMQYKNRGAECGWHAQNTIVDWKNKKIRHYPLDMDFHNDGGNDNVNQSRQNAELGFDVKGLETMSMEDALKRKEFERFIINLTGLKSPEVLVEIGKYFDKPARIWVPNNPSDVKYTSASWLGCYNYSFSIVAYRGLSYNSAARGVREP